MKPEILPLIRDAGRLLMLDIEETSLSCRKRGRRRRLRKRAASWQHLTWANAEWWRYVPISDSDTLPFSKNSLRDHAVLDAWIRLGSFTEWDAESTADLLLVLIETPFVETTVVLPLPQVSDLPVDIRPWLHDRNQLADLLAANDSFWSGACQILIEAELIEKAAATLLLRHSPTPEFCPDPYALVHFRTCLAIQNPQWSQTEVRSSLAFFRGGSIQQVRESIQNVEDMFEEDISCVAPVQRFLLSSGFSAASRWINLVRLLRQPDHRRHFLERLSQKKARLIRPPKIAVNLLQTIEKRARTHSRTQMELDGLFEMLEQKTEPWVLRDLFRLSSEITRFDLWFELPKTAVHRPNLGVLIELGRLLVLLDGNIHQRRPRSGSRVTMKLWERALRSRELCRLIEKQSWKDFDESLSGAWVRVYLLLDEIATSGPEFQELHRWLYHLIEGAPTDQRAVKLETIILLLDRLNRNPSPLLRQTIDRVSHVIAAGFDSCPDSAVNLVLDFYRYGNLNHRWALGNLSRSAFKNMADATRNHIATERLEEGLRTFLKALPEVDLEILFRQPKQFLRTLRELGCLSQNDQDLIGEFLFEHPAFTIDPHRVDLRAACDLFDHIVSDGQKDPLPAKLRDSARGRIALRPEVLAHYRSEFANSLAALQIDILKREIERSLRHYEKENLDPHTIRFLTHLGKSNRRAFKRFFQALRHGDLDYRDKHPANRLWLKQHGNLQLDGWVSRNTSSYPIATPELEGGSIRLEDNPQEELKMGSYVGSCLSVGGCNQHSAVANTLDINKRIAYLRDKKGRILARQLLAISEEEELVPFDVYCVPSCIDGVVIEGAFRRYDNHLATHLNLTLRKPEGKYTVRALLVNEWYDDYAWDMDPEPAASTAENDGATIRDREKAIA